MFIMFHCIKIIIPNEMRYNNCALQGVAENTTYWNQTHAGVKQSRHEETRRAPVDNELINFLYCLSFRIENKNIYSKP